MDILRHLQGIAEWQHGYLGRQSMQKAVLKWAVEHKYAVNSAGLADSLIATMEAELTLHNAAKPSA